MRLRQRLADDKAAGRPAQALTVSLTLDAINQAYAHKGELQFSDVTVDTATGNVQVRAQFPNPEGQLLPGLFVRAQLQQGEIANAFLVPQQSVVRTAGGTAMAWVVDGESKAQQRRVEIAQAVNDKWAVTSGLMAGDRVIVEGIIKVQPGAAVRAVDMNAPAAGSSAAEAEKGAH